MDADVDEHVDAAASPIAAAKPPDVPGFPGSRRWWDAASWTEAIRLAELVKANPDITMRDVELETGSGFWLRAMARFPALREIELLRRKGHMAHTADQRFVKQIPGDGHDVVLQKFTWNEELGGEEFTRAAMIARNQQLVTLDLKCKRDRACANCSLEFHMEVGASNLDMWICSLTGTHDVQAAAARARVLSLSPLIAPSIVAWASRGNRVQDILDCVSFPAGAMAVFSPRFIDRFNPSKEQASGIVARRKAWLRKQAGAPQSATMLQHRMQTAPKRVPRKRKATEAAIAEAAAEGEASAMVVVADTHVPGSASASSRYVLFPPDCFLIFFMVMFAICHLCNDRIDRSIVERSILSLQAGSAAMQTRISMLQRLDVYLMCT